MMTNRDKLLDLVREYNKYCKTSKDRILLIYDGYEYRFNRGTDLSLIKGKIIPCDGRVCKYCILGPNSNTCNTNFKNIILER